MKKSTVIVIALLLFQSSCSDFLELQPAHSINEDAFYKNATDFETAMIGTYSELQNLHNVTLLYLTELTTDNSEIQWTTPTAAEVECDEMRMTLSNSSVGEVWNSCFTTISRCNNILTRIDAAEMTDLLKSRYKGEALFLRAYNYFILVRLFGDLPLIEQAFTSPNEIASFDMSRKPVSQIYDLIISDLQEADGFLTGVTGLSKSRASAEAAKTLLGKVYLTQKQYELAVSTLTEVMGKYTLQPQYSTLFTGANDELAESIFEVKYLSGNIGEGNRFSTSFTPPLFNIAIFPGNMQGSGRICPTADMANAYETDDLRRPASIRDSVLLLTGKYSQNRYGVKFVDFTTGIVGDGGINYTALRYADVLLMYAEALNETSMTEQAHSPLNLVRARAGLDPLDGLSSSDFSLALERERRVEFHNEGHRWFDLVRTGRAQTVLNAHFASKGLNFSVQDHELLMPIPLRELNIDPDLTQNPGY